MQQAQQEMYTEEEGGDHDSAEGYRAAMEQVAAYSRVMNFFGARSRYDGHNGYDARNGNGAEEQGTERDGVKHDGACGEGLDGTVELMMRRGADA